MADRTNAATAGRYQCKVPGCPRDIENADKKRSSYAPRLIHKKDKERDDADGRVHDAWLPIDWNIGMKAGDGDVLLFNGYAGEKAS